MHRSFHTLSVLSFLVLASVGLKATGADAVKAPPAVVQKPETPVADDPIVPEINFNNATLEDAISSLSDQYPKFKVAILRDPNVASDFPTVNLKLKGVSLTQFMELIQTANPTVETKEIEGPGGKIICLIVHGAQNGSGPGMPATPVPVAAPVVRVYSLGFILGLPENTKSDPAAMKDAMNHALSLVKVALEQAGGEPPTLRIHEETQTLVFKGSAAQEEVLRSVIGAFQSRPRGMSAEQDMEGMKRRLVEEASTERNRMTDQFNRDREIANTKAMMRAQEMDQQMARLQKALDQRDKENLDHAGETEKLKVRLEMTLANTERLERELAKKTDEAREIRTALDAVQSHAINQPANSK